MCREWPNATARDSSRGDGGSVPASEAGCWLVDRCGNGAAGRPSKRPGCELLCRPADQLRHRARWSGIKAAHPRPVAAGNVACRPEPCPVRADA